jgi:hypothetical protein
MKKLYPPFFVLLAVVFSYSCKKEISPDLEVTVVDYDNNAIGGVWIKTSAPGAISGILDSDVIDSARTDNFGKAYFSYKNTRLLDLALYAGPNDSVIIDSLSVLLEAKRKSPRSDNTTEVKLVFR